MVTRRGRLLVEGFPHEGHEGQFDLYSIRPDGSDPVQLTDDEAGEHEPSWSPDGARIVFAAGESDLAQDVHVMNADGSDVRSLTDWEGLDPSLSGPRTGSGSRSPATATRRRNSWRATDPETRSSRVSPSTMRSDGSDVSMLFQGDAVYPVSWRP